jgi:hypothetical protein
MNLIVYLILLISVVMPQTIFDFSEKSNLDNWLIIDDVVMGGRSSGDFKLSEEGHGEFFGNVSTANYGGFSSVRYRFQPMELKNQSIIKIRLKGDGKEYQFRIKDKADRSYSYISTFSTNSEWQTIEIVLSDMYPSFRGRKLDMPNFGENTIEEIAFLIGNKKNESFQLLIDKIELL